MLVPVTSKQPLQTPTAEELAMIDARMKTLAATLNRLAVRDATLDEALRAGFAVAVDWYLFTGQTLM